MDRTLIEKCTQTRTDLLKFKTQCVSSEPKYDIVQVTLI